MRLWSLHPSLLDQKGLVAVWREGLLAQKVIGTDKGYSNHPQLDRFKDTFNLGMYPKQAVGSYLYHIVIESHNRGYSFNKSLINTLCCNVTLAIPVTYGQVMYEFEHLKRKLATRDPSRFELLQKIDAPQVHPMFRVVPGPVESWEKVAI